MKFTKKKILMICLALVLVLVAGGITYYSTQVNSLTKLGYTKKEASDKVSITTIYNIVTREKNKLKNTVSKHKEELVALGLGKEKVNSINLSNQPLTTKVTTLQKHKDSREAELNVYLTNFEKQASRFGVKYTYPEGNSYQKYIYLKNHLLKNYDALIKKYTKYLLKNGYTKSEIKAMSTGSTYQTVSKLKKEYNKDKKQTKANSGFSSKKLQSQAMRMFRETNKYRTSKGLKPYKYNYAKQSCVFKEARAYARNKNPHNWLCPCANENAALSSVNSDYVAVAMTFFKNDPPHERVLSGNYNSVAIAFVEKDGMVYMIMDVFN
ncbi:uncharacterized protein YkwD [Bacilli bacterium PM5-9]|nr:uncharacterized protein YkwD [Bacilli bacterium PM5-9]